MPRRKLTQAWVARATALPGAERTIYWDESLESFGLMVTAAGARSFVVQYRAKGISRRYTVQGQALAKARRAARSILGRVAEGGDPVSEGRKGRVDAANSLRAVAEEHLRREAKQLRSIAERRRIFERYIYPQLGARQIDSIKRSEIVRLLDRIEDRNGPSKADHVLSVLRRLMSWHATRSDYIRSPITRGMARTKPAERARERVLSDDEVRTLWAATEGWATPYAYLVRFLLLTATRLREAAEMRRQELAGDEWVIPAARHKSKRDFLLPLSPAAIDLLKMMPTIGRHGWVFTTTGESPISGFSKYKRQLDTRMLRELAARDPQPGTLQPWTNHDLRRTARSLMSRSGVEPDHAERALGHVIGGVRGIYDRHAFEREKARAFEALAELVRRILAKIATLFRCGQDMPRRGTRAAKVDALVKAERRRAEEELDWDYVFDRAWANGLNNDELGRMHKASRLKPGPARGYRLVMPKESKLLEDVDALIGKNRSLRNACAIVAKRCARSPEREKWTEGALRKFYSRHRPKSKFVT